MRHFGQFVTFCTVAVAFMAAMAAPTVVAAAEADDLKPRASLGSVGAKTARGGLRAGRTSRNAARVVLRNTSTDAIKRVSSVMRFEPARASFGKLYGLHNAADALDLKSSVALVLDADTNEILFSKNSDAVLPIASLTKLMTALVVIEANLPLNEMIGVTEDDIDNEKGSRSRLSVGTALSREEMLHLALMASENRAANALGRAYPGGLQAFVAAMNAKARSLGMKDTHYVEPTGLSSRNQSSAKDLATLVKAAQEHQMIRDFSVSHEYQVAVRNRPTQFRTTNALVRSPAWDIALQKTGYISEAGRCLVMQARMAGRQLIMVFLDSAGSYSRLGDAERVRRWVGALPLAAPSLVPEVSDMTVDVLKAAT